MKLLLHACCGPCSCYPISKLVLNYEVDVFFCNPNIQPQEEYDKRLEGAKIVSNYYKTGFTEEVLDSTFFREVGGNCSLCYETRLDKLFKYAKENGYDLVTTSLLISPYQKHELIIETLERNKKKYNIDYLYEDYRPHFREGQAMAKEMGIYRQKWCGCTYSINNR